MIRISMSLPKKLLNEFDKVLKERGYQSRQRELETLYKTTLLDING